MSMKKNQLIPLAVLVVVAAVILVVVLLATSDKSSQSSMTSTTQGGSTMTSVPSNLAACAVPGIGISLGHATTTPTHVNTPIIFTNVSKQACSMVGYPVISATNTGHTVAASAGDLAGGVAKKIGLEPGQSASAMLQAGSVPQGSQSTCRSFNLLVVTPPHTKVSKQLTTTIPACPALVVSSIKPGSSGL